MATVYIETSIVSYLTARPSRDVQVIAHQQVTQAWWRRRSAFELVVSQLELDEAFAGDEFVRRRRLRALRGIPILTLTDTAVQVAREPEAPSQRRPRWMLFTSGLPPHTRLRIC